MDSKVFSTHPLMHAAYTAIALLFTSAPAQPSLAQQHSLHHTATSALAPSESKLLGRVPASQQLHFSLALPLRYRSETTTTAA